MFQRSVSNVTKPAGLLTFDFEAECGPERRWHWSFCSNSLFYVVFFFKFSAIIL